MIDPTIISNHNQMKQESTQPTVCGQCGIEERKLLHNVRLRGNFRRLCTTCVLRLHPQCFCPACLGVYDRSPPDDAVVCFKCYSASHPSCVPSPPISSLSASRGPSPCSSCLNPNLYLLTFNRVDNGRINARVIDSNAARLLLAAGKIAAMSMNKAEVAAAMEAERRAKEAAYTKKRAREALDHVVRLMGKEKRSGVVVVESDKKVCNNVNVVDNGVGVKKVDDSNEVLEALNAVELKDNGVRAGDVDSVEKIVSETQGDGVVVMEVENGSVKNDDLVKIGENGQEQGLEKVQAVVENNVSSPVN